MEMPNISGNGETPPAMSVEPMEIMSDAVGWANVRSQPIPIRRAEVDGGEIVSNGGLMINLKRAEDWLRWLFPDSDYISRRR